MRSAPGSSAASPPVCAYQLPACRKYVLGSMHPLGRPVVPDVYNRAHSVSASVAFPISGAAEGAGIGSSSGPMTRTVRCAPPEAARRAAWWLGSDTARDSSEWPIRYSSSAGRRSELIGPTATPSHLRDKQLQKK